jgi:hypothetical protein
MSDSFRTKNRLCLTSCFIIPDVISLDRPKFGCERIFGTMKLRFSSSIGKCILYFISQLQFFHPVSWIVKLKYIVLSIICTVAGSKFLFWVPFWRYFNTANDLPSHDLVLAANVIFMLPKNPVDSQDTRQHVGTWFQSIPSKIIAGEILERRYVKFALLTLFLAQFSTLVGTPSLKVDWLWFFCDILLLGPFYFILPVTCCCSFLVLGKYVVYCLFQRSAL